MIHETKFDSITLSETWVKNQKHLLEYVNLPGYKLSYRNRNKKEVVMVEYTWRAALTTKFGMKLLVLMKCYNIYGVQGKSKRPPY